IDGETPDVVFEGSANNDRLGRGEIYSVGDINGDGKTDFAFSTDNKIFIAYGGDSGGVVSNYDLTGFQALVGRRIGYGNFNGDSYSDLVVADNNKVLVYYGSSSGISAPASITINDISPINYTYPPSVANFARAVSPEMTDFNGDGISDIVVASDRGLLIYNTNDGAMQTFPSFLDSFINTTSTNLKVFALDYGVVYCNNATNTGSCYILNYGE
ncbi:MAG TPA: VCBS repeat-containing protein, partial [bacterium]|nr:VCBS repeat-containing protein [bacterium]